MSDSPPHDGLVGLLVKTSTSIAADLDSIPALALDLFSRSSQGKRKVGRPKQAWRRSTDAEIKAAGTTWAELKRTSQNRVRWWRVVAAVCSTRNQEA